MKAEEYHSQGHSRSMAHEWLENDPVESEQNGKVNILRSHYTYSLVDNATENDSQEEFCEKYILEESYSRYKY
jgi:hypothetical protein